MAERRRALTADERLAEVQRDHRRLARERMIREVAGPRWRRMIRVTPALFDRQGVWHVRALLAEREVVIDALKQEAVFALDTALRVQRGHGLFAGGDVHAYLTSPRGLDELVERGLIERAAHPSVALVRPLGGPPRLLAALVEELPPHHTLPSGHRVVTRERLQRELIGALGARADLFALVEALRE